MDPVNFYVDLLKTDLKLGKDIDNIFFNRQSGQEWQETETKPFNTYCSFSRETNPELHYSCLDNDIIDDLINLYNKKNTNNTIKKGTKKEMFDEYKKRRNVKEDVCVIKTKQFAELSSSPTLKRKLKNMPFDLSLAELYYKIPIPKKKYEWLSNFDIDKVMAQLEKKYVKFDYLITSPMDFQTVKETDIYREAAEINLSKLYEKGGSDIINTIAIVLNTDYYGQGGSHWVCCFIDLRSCDYIKANSKDAWEKFYKNGEYKCGEPTFEFFDSVGSGPTPEVKKYYEKLKKQYPTLKFKSNSVSHQKKNSECGNYCILYILSRLNGVPAELFDNPKIRMADEWVNKQRRDIIFLKMPAVCSYVKND